jgi:CTP:molybdopterin cytidylyltransferase MocA
MRAVAGLVLAAGAGRRFGRPKALVEWQGDRLVERAVRVLVEGGCAPVSVVAGAAALDVPGAAVVTNDEWRSGMASSLRAGLAALPDDADAVVVSLVDQPGITSEAVRRVVAGLGEGRPAVVATYMTVPRNPVALDRSVWPEVMSEAVGDEGARTWLRRHPEAVTRVECADVASAHDIDTPADLDPQHDPGELAGGAFIAGGLASMLYQAYQQREWHVAERLLHADASVSMPATAEELRGRDAVIGFQRAYPEPWGDLRVLRAVSHGDTAAVELQVDAPAGVFRCAAFWAVADGLLRDGVEYWVTVGGDEPPPERRGEGFQGS